MTDISLSNYDYSKFKLGNDKKTNIKDTSINQYKDGTDKFNKDLLEEDTFVSTLKSNESNAMSEADLKKVFNFFTGEDGKVTQDEIEYLASLGKDDGVLNGRDIEALLKNINNLQNTKEEGEYLYKANDKLIEKNGNVYVKVEDWNNNTNANNCLSRIIKNNYDLEKMNIKMYSKEYYALEKALMDANPQIYGTEDGGWRTEVGGKGRQNAVIYTGEQILLPGYGETQKAKTPSGSTVKPQATPTLSGTTVKPQATPTPSGNVNPFQNYDKNLFGWLEDGRAGKTATDTFTKFVNRKIGVDEVFKKMADGGGDLKINERLAITNFLNEYGYLKHCDNLSTYSKYGGGLEKMYYDVITEPNGGSGYQQLNIINKYFGKNGEFTKSGLFNPNNIKEPYKSEIVEKFNEMYNYKLENGQPLNDNIKNDIIKRFPFDDVEFPINQKVNQYCNEFANGNVDNLETMLNDSSITDGDKAEILNAAINNGFADKLQEKETYSVHDYGKSYTGHHDYVAQWCKNALNNSENLSVEDLKKIKEVHDNYLVNLSYYGNSSKEEYYQSWVDIYNNKCKSVNDFNSLQNAYPISDLAYDIENWNEKEGKALSKDLYNTISKLYNFDVNLSDKDHDAVENYLNDNKTRNRANNAADIIWDYYKAGDKGSLNRNQAKHLLNRLIRNEGIDKVVENLYKSGVSADVTKWFFELLTN